MYAATRDAEVSFSPVAWAIFARVRAESASHRSVVVPFTHEPLRALVVDGTHSTELRDAVSEFKGAMGRLFPEQLFKATIAVDGVHVDWTTRFSQI